ncbi:MAG: hypothetical protein M5T61_21530 [Acidimicrobiia bacterium]|nr:hypothetical protein [Acidimicrobiia bacterium]
MKAAAVRQLVDAGYTPVSAMQAVQDGDLTILEHSGLYSVQLQPPQPNGPAPVGERRRPPGWGDGAESDRVAATSGTQRLDERCIR